MINIIESINKSSSNGIDASKKLVTSTIKYTKLKAYYLTSLTAASAVKVVLIGGFLSVGLIFISFFGALAIGNYLANNALGYLIVSGFYFLIAFIFLLLKKQIEKIILKKISKKIFDK